MVAGAAPVGALLLIFICSAVIQTAYTEDIYWEGEEEPANEFLEVKEEPWAIGAVLKRVRRGWFDFLSPTTTETPTPAPAPASEGDPVSGNLIDPVDDNADGDDDDLGLNFGSGAVPEREQEPKERTLRVSFVVMEPYQQQYSDRDSEQFQNLSKSLADAVNELYSDLPGDQRASLVRIQSRPADEFSCKVTLDIATVGYDDLQRIAETLRQHIRARGKLGYIIVKDIDFRSVPIIPDVVMPECTADEFQCDTGHCVATSSRCNRVSDCPDGSDENDCKDDVLAQTTTPPPPAPLPEIGDNESVDETNTESDLDIYESTTEAATTPTPAREKCAAPKSCSFSLGTTYCPNQECDGVSDCPFSDDERNCDKPKATDCAQDEMRCDDTRCVLLKQRCDGIRDCTDGKDEEGCNTESCGADDFRCNDGKCIAASKRCDQVVDCSREEDEQNCPCRDNEFRCVSDGSCIESRKRCDGTSHCLDGSDEANCGAPTCDPDSFTCINGACATRCDDVQECETGEDEEDCDDECPHFCDGRCLVADLICNNQNDCLDGSDELNCDLCDGRDDFRCHRSGECIKQTQRCNNITECADGSDELDCQNIQSPKYQGCNADQFQCSNGICINDSFRCDGNTDCTDNSDELDCPCQSNQWKCRSGQCISYSDYCNGIRDCQDNSDEQSCPPRPYPPQQYPYPFPDTTTVRPYFEPTTVPSYFPSYVTENQDRNGCQRSEWRCENGPCIGAHQRCDGRVDCPRDQSDELDCPADRPPALDLRTYPDDQTVRSANFGGDVVFQCRDEGPKRSPVQWVREDGRPLKPGFSQRDGRLELYRVTPDDSGVYLCQASTYLRYPGSSLRVTLTVEPPNAVQSRFGSDTCELNEATCGNGQCIPKSALCNGVRDCSDGSDEDECNRNGRCEPNQFHCANSRCVLKSWLCDSEDDCGDGSDEQNCGTTVPGQPCLPVEFTCARDNQCVPKSFHCDGRNDCFDGSDEVGCAPVYITRPPQPQNVRLNPGETLTLVCEAVGVPTPLITWRLNWGHVPPQCRSTSVDGVGTLTCPNMQYENSGAYSCEAINNRGTNFAVPDTIVFVNGSSSHVCPRGYFNSEAQSESECIRCFCFGESTECRSADLFTYNMPTPLGKGGTRLLGVKASFTGDVQIDNQPITDQYFYDSLRNGAAVTKLENNPRSYATSRISHPYISLPESYQGNQLTSYGGSIKYNLQPHTERYAYDNNVPDIIIKGKFGTILHYHRHINEKAKTIEARLVPQNWKKASPNGPIQVSREDIMMALDNIESILLRADLNGAGVNIMDFNMESANHINVGLGAASLVEECTCPPGYEGLSCQKCAGGYVRESSGPWLGNCVPEQRECPPGTYGNPGSGFGCQPCPCPLTGSRNNFARTCSLGPSGNVVCDCIPGYDGERCEVCAPGYVGNPTVPGDSCRPQPQDNCNPLGTSRVRGLDQCECKANVQGRYCDQCNQNAFFLSEDFRHGCAQCFCSGVTQECTSSDLRRKTTTVYFNVPQITDQVRVYNSTPISLLGTTRYEAPVETNLKPVYYRGEMVLNSVDQSTIYYWSLPAIFAGDKVTSYGGYLRYTLRHVPQFNGQVSKNNAPDVQLISLNHPTFHYYSNSQPNPDGTMSASVQFLERGWQRPDGKEVLREHLLLALADVKTILIKATYALNSQLATIESASIDTAEPDGTGPPALHVEQCRCPVGYVGPSCEDCAAGYTRNGEGLYLEQCGLCECNGHSAMCDRETGSCYDCEDNTDGLQCESCKPGFQKDVNDRCVPSREPPPITDCNCVQAGMERCVGGRCVCKQNVEGESCERCRPGSFALSADNPDGCLPCYCSGVTNNCHEGQRYTRIPMPAPIFGENFGGYTLMNLNADSVIKNQFVPATNESELLYEFSYPPNEELYWSLPFAGNQILSYGGKLSLRQMFSTGGYPVNSEPGTDVVLISDDNSVYWTNPNIIRNDASLTYLVPLTEDEWFNLNSATPASRADFMSVLKKLRRVLVRATLTRDVRLQSTSIADVSMDTATDSFDGLPAKGVEVCMCPEGHSGTSCELCSSGYYSDQRGSCRQCPCNGHRCSLGPYNDVICECRPPYTGRDCSSLVGENQNPDVTTRPPPPQTTVIVTITSPSIRIEEIGGSVNFTCRAQSQISRSPLTVHWRKSGGNLPQGRTYTDDRTGLLLITNVQVTDSGQYICRANDGANIQEATVSLQVPGNQMTVPTVTVNPPYKEYYEGDRIELECVTTGIPTPRVTWQRAVNRALPQATENFDTYLVIERATEEDSGEYRCIATNQAGSTDVVAVVSVRPRPSLPQRDKLTVSPPAVNIVEGRTTRVVCTGTTNVPPGSIGWIRQDGAQLPQNVRPENGILYIDSARPEDSGVYICQTTSPEVYPVPVLVMVESVSTPPPSETPTVSVNGIDRVTVPTGERVLIDCVASGYPLPLIRWKKYEGEFGPQTSQRDNSLVIASAQESDQGYYVCEGTIANAPVANVYVYVEIERREPPVVEIWPQGEQAVPLGGQFEFSCRALGGYPEPDLSWSRSGGRSLSSDTHLTKNNNGLRFDRIAVNDEGEYICTGTNVAGSSSASGVLKVRSLPEIVLSQGYVNVYIGDPANVDCRASGYPEPTITITKDHPDYRELVPPSRGNAALRINSASHQDDGTYTCTATSAAGTSEQKFVINVERGDGGFDLGGGSGEGEIGIDEPRPGEEERPGALLAIEGQDAKITCNVSSGEYDVRWSRADRRPLGNNAYQIGNELIISRATKADAGDYECILTNRYGIPQQSAFTHLEVVRPPRITLRPPTQVVHPGDSPTVECIVDGDDIQDVYWAPSRAPPSRRVEFQRNLLIFHQIEVEDAGKYECFARNSIANSSAVAEVIVNGTRNEPPPSQSLVTIDQPRRQYRVGDNVEVLCRGMSRDVRVKWERLGTRQYVETRTYGDGAQLLINGVEESDVDVYRCTGENAYGQTSYDDFNLEVIPGRRVPSNSVDNTDKVVSAPLRSNVDMPCKHNLEPPVSYEWRREYVPLPAEIRTNEAYIHLEQVTEAEAGTYTCRASNNRVAVEAHTRLRVTGVIPAFRDNSWLSLPRIKDAYSRFEIEISLKPADSEGIILYNSQNQGREGDFIALQLLEGRPQFVIDTGNGPVLVEGDRPLQLNTWHTIRINGIGNKVTMDVDNAGPFVKEWENNIPPPVLDLVQPLYVGGVPDYNQLPEALAGASGFYGCVSMLILGSTEVNIMLDRIDAMNINECDSCAPNVCLNNGVCQEARNEVGYTCICPAGFAGRDCGRTGEACHPGLCGPGKCLDTADGYKCSCPATYSGKRCENQQIIEYPAFTGNAFVALDTPRPSRLFRISMKIKASTSPIPDGIIMYCAESARGYGGFTSLAVRNGRLEFRYDLGDGSGPVVLTSRRALLSNEWTEVLLTRLAGTVSMNVNMIDAVNGTVSSPRKLLEFATPLFVGGYDDSVGLNPNTGVSGGFSGCVKDVEVLGQPVDIVNSSIKSANIQECTEHKDRGDIQENEIRLGPCAGGGSCQNGGYCRSSEAAVCTCPGGYSGAYCEHEQRSARSACDARPCRYGSVCRPSPYDRQNYTCDCPLGYAGTNCQMRLELLQSVGFNGNGYIELPSNLISYENLETDPAVVALGVHTTQDGVLFYQREANSPPTRGDYLLLRVENGKVVMEWDLGAGPSILIADEVHVTDGERHQIIAKLLGADQSNDAFLSVDGHAKYGMRVGFSKTMNADSNIYIGGIPEALQLNYPGFVGCFDQVELMNRDRGLNLGQTAVAARNTQRCRD